MAGFGNIIRMARTVLTSKKTQEAIRSEKGQQISGRLLDGAEGVAGRVTGGKHDAAIAKARRLADEKLGRDGPGRDGPGRDGPPLDGGTRPRPPK